MGHKKVIDLFLGLVHYGHMGKQKGENRMSTFFKVRIAPEEYAHIMLFANKRKMTFSDYIRFMALREYNKEQITKELSVLKKEALKNNVSADEFANKVIVFLEKWDPVLRDVLGDDMIFVEKSIAVLKEAVFKRIAIKEADFGVYNDIISKAMKEKGATVHP